MSAIATVPDLLRVLVLPVFGYVAWRDIKTRRVPNRTWLPLAALGIVLLAWETYRLLNGDATDLERRQFAVRAVISIGFLIPLTYGFWLLGGFGGADAKAFFVIGLLFPTYPEYSLDAAGVEGTLATLPVVATEVGVFSFTILSNTVLVGVLYPVVLAGKNAATGYVSPGMFVATPIRWDETTTEYGTMLDFPDRGLADDLSLSGLRSYFSWRSLDLDALRMYLQWRGCSLADLRENPDRYRDPASLPEDPNPPGDGSLAPDGGTPASDGSLAPDGGTPASDGSADDGGAVGDAGDRDPYDDPWGAEAFLDGIDGTAYGTAPGTLRNGLDTLTTDDVVWISPGIPFLVPLFVGLVVAFTYGDLLFALLTGLGFV